MPGQQGPQHMSALRTALLLLALGIPAATQGADGFSQWLDQALTNPSVQAEEQRLEGARRVSDAAALAYLGSGNGSAESLRFDDRHFVGAFTPESFAAPTFDRTFTRFGVSYAVPLDLFGVIAAARRAAGSDRAAAELSLRQQRLLSLHTLTLNYAQLVALRLRGAMLETQSARIAQTHERVRLQMDNGDAAHADLRLAEAERARLEAESERLSGARAHALAAISAVIGHEAIDPGGPLPMLPPWSFAPADDSALPVAAAVSRADSAAAQARHARRALYPALAAVGEYASFESDADVPDTWALGARLSLPIDPAGWSRASALRSEAEAARSGIEAARRQLRAQTAVLAAQYRSTQAEARALRAECDAIAEVVDVTTELHRVGMASLEELLRHERDLREAEARLAEAQSQALIAWSSQAVLSGLGVDSYRAALVGP